MELNLRSFLFPLLPAPDGGQICLLIIGLERHDVTLKDAYGRTLQTFPHQGPPWTVARLVELADQILLPNDESADLFLGDQMIGSTDISLLNLQPNSS